MTEKLIAAALLVTTLASIAVAVYFLLVYYRRIPPNSRMVPAFCHIEEGTCSVAVFSHYGRVLLGIPNSAFAVAYYAAVMVIGVWTLVSGPPPWLGWFLLAAGGTVAASLYLIWALRVKLQTH